MRGKKLSPAEREKVIRLGDHYPLGYVAKVTGFDRKTIKKYITEKEE